VGRREELVMPDTGLPWEIPYAAPADLVRDWPALSEDVADAVAAGLSAAGPAGIGSNVVQTVKTDTFITSSGTYTTVTGLTVSITPTLATSKILVIADVKVGQTNSGRTANIRLVRGASALYVGDAASSRTSSSFGAVGQFSTAGFGMFGPTLVFLDSPNTTSSTTYGFEIMSPNSGSAVVNRYGDDADDSNRPRTASSITVIEVAP
jgi:hypothetical protein